MTKKPSNNVKEIMSAVIVAAGRGTRMNLEQNKQYIDVLGKPILARTLQVFEDCIAIDEIIVVVNEQDIIYCKENVIDRYNLLKVKALVTGGAERQNSVYNGLLQVDPRCSLVIIQDGARPFISKDCIYAGIEAAKDFGAACMAVPVKDTIKKSDSEGFVHETIDRSMLWSIQTPQIFKYDLIMNAHKEATKSNFLGTDDAVLIERLGLRLKLVMGSYDNIKITTIEDLAVAEAILERRGQ